MITKNRMKFLAPDEGSVGGGEPSKGAAALTTEPPVVPTSGSSAGEEAKPTATIDAKEFAQQFGEVISKAIKPTDPPVVVPKKVDELTPEEAAKELNVWDPPEDWYIRYDNLDTRKQAIREMRDGMFKHFDTVTQRRLQEALGGLNGQIGPLKDFMAQYQADRIDQRFETKYEQIAKPELSPLRDAIVADLTNKGQKFKTVDDLVDAIAKGMEAVIQVSDPNFKLTAGSSPAKPNKGQSANSIPVTTPGAGGSAAAKGATPAKKLGDAIFE